MSSDGRYMYHPSQGISPPYDYSSYPPPPPSYDNAQVPQAPLRPMRSNSSSQPHSPHQQSQFNPPQPPYPPNYAPGPYMPPPPPQWTGDNWTHYNQSFPPTAPPPPPPPSEGPFSSGQSRPEAVPSSSTESRSYPLIPNSDPRRIDERQGPLPNPPAQPKSRRREKESSPSAVSPVTPTGLDFMKLLESYRVIIDASETLSSGGLSAPGRPAAETMERMLQSATYGAQMLESATQQQPTPSAAPRSPIEKEPEEPKEATNGAATSSKRQKADDSVQEGQTCLGCNATSTPEWRRGPMGPRTLCNACGLVYAKLIKKRVREGGRASGKSNGQGGTGLEDDSGFASTGEGDSEDDDEYGSQDHQSDLGDGGRD